MEKGSNREDSRLAVFSRTGLKPKVLICHHCSQIGGAELSLLELIQLLSSEIQVEVWLPKGPLFDLLEENGILVQNVQVPFFKKSLFSWPRAFFHLIRFRATYMKRNRQDDLLFANSTHSMIALRFLPKHLKKIWQIRDYPNSRFLTRSLSRSSNLILCPTQDLKNKLVDFQADSSKIFVLGHGISLSHFEKKQRKNIGHEKRNEIQTIGMLAQWIPWKRQREFIHMAIAMLEGGSHLQFLMSGGCFGKASYNYKQACLDLINQADLGEKLQVLDPVENGIEFLHKIDILVHPAYPEPMGRVLLEAMALKKVVVAVDEGGPGEMIQHGENGLLVKASELKSLPKTLEKVLKDTSYKKELGEKAQESFLTHWKLEDRKEDYMNMIRNLLD